MTLYLVRHDDTKLQGVCYGQTDVPSAIPYSQTADQLRGQLPASPDLIVSSPLARCRRLAEALYSSSRISMDNDLMEVNFGDWENQPWDNIPEEAITQWAQTPTRFAFPGGESLDNFKHRSQRMFLNCQTQETVVVFTHAGIIRHWLALYREKPWESQLNTPVPFGRGFKLKSGTVCQL